MYIYIYSFTFIWNILLNIVFYWRINKGDDFIQYKTTILLYKRRPLIWRSHTNNDGKRTKLGNMLQCLCWEKRLNVFLTLWMIWIHINISLRERVFWIAIQICEFNRIYNRVLLMYILMICLYKCKLKPAWIIVYKR